MEKWLNKILNWIELGLRFLIALCFAVLALIIVVGFLVAMFNALRELFK